MHMTYIPDATRDAVRQRAYHRCEYCGLPEGYSFYRHQIDHIIPLKHRGDSDVVNLALACFDCNNAKSSDVASYDEDTNQLTPLYNPRTQIWAEHFVMENGIIKGKTAIGRVTVLTLNMNSVDQIATRNDLNQAGVW